MRLLPCGRDAVLVDLASLAEVDAVHRALRAAVDAGRLPGVVDVVPAARTVLVTAAPGGPADALDEVRRVVAEADLDAGTDPPDGPELELAVHYDGEDLDLVADTAGTDRPGVVALHTGAGHTVAFGGFAPGFAYLTGLPDALDQPRLDTPRPRIPAGAVGVAGGFSGVYPRSSPGGWRLVGRLADGAPRLFDPERDPPALLVPGTRVRFVDAG